MIILSSAYLWQEKGSNKSFCTFWGQITSVCIQQLAPPHH